jgi:hypothetical protein
MERICPLLSLAGERRSVVLGADPAHECGAEPVPVPLDRIIQARLCLTNGHVRCQRYRAHLERYGDPRRGEHALEPGYVRTRLHLVPERSWRAIASRTRRTPVGRTAVTLAAALVLAAAAGAVVAGVGVPAALGPEPPPVGRVLSASPAGERTTPFVFATLAPIHTQAPTPTPAPTQTPAATPPPTAPPSPTQPPAQAAPPTPAPATTYVVQEGDSLNSIALAYGVTPEALAAANGIEDPDLIEIGRVLVIPEG